MIFFVIDLLTLALVCWARYIEDRDMKAITSKSFLLISLTVGGNMFADIGSVQCAYLVFVNFGTPLTNMSYASALQVSCLAKEWDTEHFARHFHS